MVEISETPYLPCRYILSAPRQTVSAEDPILVRRCLKGDETAIQALVERYQSDVFGLCVRLLHHRQDAEDVTQEVFLRVFRSLKRWDQARPLKPWIMGITVNRCRTWMAQRVRRPELVDYLHETASSEPSDDGDAQATYLMQSPPCREQHAGAVSMIEVLKKTPNLELPANFAKSMVANVIRDRLVRRRRMQRRVFVSMSLAASILIVLAFAYTWL